MTASTDRTTAHGLNRDRFPGLRDGWIRADAPGGTQPVDSCIAAIGEYMASGRSANLHGRFAASRATDALVAQARARVGRLLGADPGGVVFGASMTALTFRLAHAVSATLRAGERIVTTRLEHDANVRPWAGAARRAGADLAFIELDPRTLELSPESIASTIDERTRWVAVGAASNAVGAVADLAPVIARAHEVGARVFVDAVAAAAHIRFDLADQGIDALACSAYKWFGPHVGILCLSPQLTELLRPEKLIPSPSRPPESWELGTLPMESLAGVIAAVDYLEEIGMDVIARHDDALTARLIGGLEAIAGVRVLGQPARRTPTAFFTVEGLRPRDVASGLAERRIAAADGDVYAHELCTLLGFGAEGAARLGFAHYSGLEDVDQAVAAVAAIASASRNGV
ncbi:cysteine desulfurase-like protein [Conexibacter sp. CPCC 206217]|uniref:cysteine desulfurase-like protein n=1 Tax=Conexibacter sp. CPCC 206217 TaxID=3064574 RepID=UPI00272000E7|nr:cysteine desulfurase-like protein [Conexibacter sp. CPCC 206217]MDO8208812.1 cysteine desulfurase-like protein [Conexibacter sp. CPCC 206217]